MEITGAWALHLPFGPTAKFRLYQGSACRRRIRPRGCGPWGRAPSSPWLTSSSPPFPGLRQGCSSVLILDHLLQVREWVWSGLISGQGICLQVEGRRFETTGVAWHGRWRQCPDRASRGTWFEADFALTMSQETCVKIGNRHKNPGFWVVLKMDRRGLALAAFLCRGGCPELNAGCLCTLARVLVPTVPSASCCVRWPPASSLRVLTGTQLPWGT